MLFYLALILCPWIMIYAEHASSLQHAQECLHNHHLTQADYYLSQALEQFPKNKDDMLTLGNSLLQLGNRYLDAHETEKAITTYRKIFALPLPHHMVYHNLGFILSEQKGAYYESLEYYKKAIALNSNDAATHLGYGISLLACGNFLEGFAEYEWRWMYWNHSTSERNRKLIYPLPHAWTGQSLENKTICLRCEQGCGDMFMFIRYALLLKNQGARVIVESQESTAPLLSLCPYIDQVIICGDPLPSFDYQIPMLSLPIPFKTTLATIPAPIPYLYASTSLVKRWQKMLKHDTHFKIGICWQGKRWNDNAARSIARWMPFDYFAQLAYIKDVSVYSLQKNESIYLDTYEQARKTNILLSEGDFDESNGAFMDTAALIKNLDLVITIDTSIAHLAGALGVPTWVILPFAAEWRWLTHGDTSPWYPTMRLFRQKKYGEWQAVIDEIIITLKEMALPAVPRYKLPSAIHSHPSHKATEGEAG